MRPVERAASVWPRGMDWMPPRTTSAVSAIIRRDMAGTAAGKVGILTPMAAGRRK
ncbi:MAG TPA: hypothetical protein VLM91_15435 [Candidatus Methylomirabilis sp.]|nr:hypothetical protein [Candidatus Methylomirabilis sp.]